MASLMNKHAKLSTLVQIKFQVLVAWAFKRSMAADMTREEERRAEEEEERQRKEEKEK